MIPDKYDGTVLRERDDETVEQKRTQGVECCERVCEDKIEKESDGGIFSALFKGIGRLKIPFSQRSIGTEELLLLALAADLFFSSEADRECAIMLAILIFIT